MIQGEHADLARFESAVTDTASILLVDVKGNVAATGNDSDQVGLARVFLDGRAIAKEQVAAVRSIL